MWFYLSRKGPDKSVKIEDWLFLKGKKEKLRWIGEPLKKNNIC